MLSYIKALYKVPRLLWLLKGKDFVPERDAHYISMRDDTNPEGYVKHPGLEDIPYSPVHRFENWCEQIIIRHLHIFRPLDAQQCVKLANFAHQHKMPLRPYGKMHGWAPLVANSKEARHEKGEPQKMFFLDTGNLRRADFRIVDGRPQATLGVGLTLLDATQFLQNITDAKTPHGYSFVNMPGPGSLSIGGLLAIGGHGTSVPHKGEPELELTGCLSNLILSFKAVVSEHRGDQIVYVEKEFNRGQEDAAAFLVHLGRAFITEVTMRVVPNYFLEVHNKYINDTELFQAPSNQLSANSVQAIVETYGRVEVLFFPYTKRVWVKWWNKVNGFTVNPVSTPYNYKFTNILSPQTCAKIQKLFNDDPDVTPILMKVFLLISELAKHGRESWVMSGLSKDLLLYVEDNTLRATMMGYVVHINRSDIQKTANAFYEKFNAMMKGYAQRGIYPVNAPLEIRFTGLDNAHQVHTGYANAEVPLLGASGPMNPAHPNPALDTAFWVDILALPETHGAADFFEELEAWMYQTWPGVLRPEWSKAWGYTKQHGAWSNETILKKHIPESYQQTLARARDILNKYDEGRIYKNQLLDKILP